MLDTLRLAFDLVLALQDFLETRGVLSRSGSEEEGFKFKVDDDVFRITVHPEDDEVTKQLKKELSGPERRRKVFFLKKIEKFYPNLKKISPFMVA